jgi:phosphonate transport system ATP-binding protein
VELAGVTVRYDRGVAPGAAPALDRVDLMVGEGERVALLGASGAGKSTLLAVAGGLVAPGEGSVSVLGTDPTVPSPLRPGARSRVQRSRVGLISQQLDLVLPLRVVHNVNAGRLGRWSTLAALWSLVVPRARHEVVEALDRVDLGDRFWSRTDELSGGERQRVAVARVLHQRPDLVLGDEPTSSVDPHLADRIMGLLVDGPWTTVVSVHDPELARRHATRLVGLREGRIVFDAAPSAVSDDDLARLYRSAPTR